ncbi:hypothetical protein Bca52824_040755 [Brassica carinata]|uniref:Uncharacterized protein n=1 Tax=Brassica carinata TaxID=52824 RepID=A0A8X7RTR2_BRACI|nr:hypothetical protein Bca52824_040755 [Brassica carinata]
MFSIALGAMLRSFPYMLHFTLGVKDVFTQIAKDVVAHASDRAAVEFHPATALVDKPSFFTPKYQTKGKAVDDEEGEDEAAQAIRMIHNPISYSHRTPASTSCKSFHRAPPAPATTLERSELKDKQRHATQDLGCHFRVSAMWLPKG